MYQPVWPDKNRQISIKLPKNDFTRKINDFDTFQKLPNNVGDLGKIIVATGLKWLPKVQKSPNLVTLVPARMLSFLKQPFYRKIEYFNRIRTRIITIKAGTVTTWPSPWPMDNKKRSKQPLEVMFLLLCNTCDISSFATQISKQTV